MGFIINNQGFTASSSGVSSSSLASQFHDAMDTVLVTCGRNVTLHLPPTKSPCSSSDCTYNSFYHRYVNQQGKVCETCKGEGWTIEPRFTTYLSNIRWTEEPYYRGNEETQGFGRIGSDFCRTKMHKTAFSHIKEAVGATIDGINVSLYEEPRLTGFAGELFYVVTFWKVNNK